MTKTKNQIGSHFEGGKYEKSEKSGVMYSERLGVQLGEHQFSNVNNESKKSRHFPDAAFDILCCIVRAQLLFSSIHDQTARVASCKREIYG